MIDQFGIAIRTNHGPGFIFVFAFRANRHVLVPAPPFFSERHIENVDCLLNSIGRYGDLEVGGLVGV